jgi:hypothetical protein
VLEDEDEDEDEEFDDREYEDDDDVNEEESEEEGAHQQKQKETEIHTQSEAPSSSLEAEALERVKQDIRARAERLAHDLGLPFFAEPPSAQLSRQFEFLVEVAPHRLQVTQRKHAAPAKRYPPSAVHCRVNMWLIIIIIVGCVCVCVWQDGARVR